MLTLDYQCSYLGCFGSIAFQGAEVVFHMAAPNSSINNYQLHRSVNVDGRKYVPYWLSASLFCTIESLLVILVSYGLQEQRTLLMLALN